VRAQRAADPDPSRLPGAAVRHPPLRAGRRRPGPGHRRTGGHPVPFLLAEVFASNVGGTATLIGDPPNIIIAGRAGLSFNDFLVHLTPIVVVLLGALLLLCRVMFRDQFAYDPKRTAQLMELDEREAISDGGLLIKSGLVLLAVLVGFVVGASTGMAPATVALLGAGVLVLISGLPPRDYLADVEAPRCCSSWVCSSWSGP
jgi:Na+/H+ antiporter NhaD/arsenite permease-like protein